MIYQVEITSRAAKQLKKLPEDIKLRIEEKIQELAENPRPDGVVKLEDSEDTYRVRVGKYRILYEVKDDLLIVKVVKVGHRKDVYKK
ncbi:MULTISPECIES: type II toxin-antitoxin system RelE family toxin [Fischerella]|uniref:Type II toxin-antitoxin system RelE/ParE family toxin n=2 Tax=Fischerella TaxID=1190 RepID=A0A2N6JYV2_FISMU|nr:MULTISPECIES: type II toxin-antitoxin system RelE/ParE family toxin [Fischerella]MBD2434639.1 type II toxin-antitoxin system RelE/ParE family toxin [Fischerella sp. FACHB-380]PLZ86257.1 type II toxin-antitoxin system RelE/ParE family toxin [Fischerella muscicola CCMEE 5323]PMB40030.1 type II toxin-antitoxin system mRNA interferase toxin, RelE/StbE family [Fischerella thermalis CCMEE 5330]PMB52134.1 type II toxin-antitoxin system mRNA interferase toxin, RelE/StbE family [Fischerella thermalis